MAEGVAADNDASASRASEQARLRKERREAKIKSGGSARLNKINGMGGRVVGDRDEPAANPNTSSPALAAATAAAGAARRTSSSSQPAHADPDEVDISEHFYSPASNRRPAAGGAAPPSPFGAEGGASEAQLRQMMLGLDRGNTPGASGPGTPGAEDPMMKMMQQMMAGAGAGAGGAGPDANPFAGMMPPQAQQQQASGPDLYTTIWRILHALVALGLGLYVVFLTPFTGTKAQREMAYADEVSTTGGELWAELEQHKKNFFWAFATAEAVLLTARFFLDNGRAPPPGFLWTIIAQVPEPWKGYISSVVRYGQIFTTVRSDILLCVFVLGACSWYKSLA